jgi:hypothetical protein
MRVWRPSATKQNVTHQRVNFIKLLQHNHVERSWLSAPIMVQLENEALSLETEHPQRYVNGTTAPIIWPVVTNPQVTISKATHSGSLKTLSTQADKEES